MNINEIIKQSNFDDDEKNIVYELSKQIESGNMNVTVRQLSKLTYCSPSKIVRFAKKIGFYGYSDMLFSFRKQMDEIVELKFKDSLTTVVILEDSLKMIDQLIEDLTSKQYNSVYLQGLGYSNYVCDYFRDKLIELGIFAACVNPLDVIKDKYILIIVSNSGETEDLVKIVKTCRNDDCIIYVITSQEKSKLCKLVPNAIIITQKNDLKINEQGSYFIGNAIVLMEKVSKIISDFKKIGE
ncbi:MurR/RpiR family transcriptional regulator [Anaerorhabdus sp.]|uniref:MurR/RpiR family transcriptional regulator n=1 Tax=Anaerorhabdus sp. TaxID=1872524 RepID=UPI002FC85DF6